jgi:transcriptional regulator with XRE-family HTH domain
MPRYRLNPKAERVTPLKRWIVKKGLTYEDLAERAAAEGHPVAAGTIRNIAGGKRTSYDNALALEAATKAQVKAGEIMRPFGADRRAAAKTEAA